MIINLLARLTALLIIIAGHAVFGVGWTAGIFVGGIAMLILFRLKTGYWFDA
ncbi:hypothetical protein [Azospirillum sp. TSA2s]|uniref:hypothetical protein n=1 Tax=Azospirillum sp. TSA2s TaxID=709810 RepID=UPI00145C13D8|nr:hypothetical protein [Azospirillum sp. TSA2s]